MAAMLEEHQKRLSLFRMGKAHMKKVVLKDDDQAATDFAAYVPLADYWPHGQHDVQDEEPSKPVMLNSRAQLSLLRKSAMPWSSEHRGFHHRHHRRHSHSAALVEKSKNATKPVVEESKNATKPVTKASNLTKTAPMNTTRKAAPMNTTLKAATATKAPLEESKNTTKAVTKPVSKASNGSKTAPMNTTLKATAPSKVTVEKKTSNTTAPVKAPEPAKKK